jgi:hypothetical protein
MPIIEIIQSHFASYFASKSGKPPFGSYKKIQGWLTPVEALGLRYVASQLTENARVLEIGSWKGKSTFCIAHGLSNGTIECIDPFNADGESQSKSVYDNEKGEEDLLMQFKNNLTIVNDKIQIIPHKGYSNEFVGKIPAVDFLFIDGDHSIEGCTFDFDNFENIVKQGGYLAFHDYHPKRKEVGPTHVIEQIVSKNRNYTWKYRFDSLVVFKKVNS